jgi:hypothetical protein
LWGGDAMSGAAGGASASAPRATVTLDALLRFVFPPGELHARSAARLVLAAL